MMRKVKDLGRRSAPWGGLLVAVLLLTALIPVGETLWVKVLEITGTVHTRTPGGASLLVEKTATGFRELLPDGTEVFGVSGEICVTNTGDLPTENLKITDVPQFKTEPGMFMDLVPPTDMDVSANPVLDPGESHCYPYKIIFTPVEGATYRNLATAIVTNHPAHPGEEFGVQATAEFTLPEALILLEEATATPTSTETPTSTPEPTPTSTETPTPEPTPTPTPEPTQTPTPTP